MFDGVNCGVLFSIKEMGVNYDGVGFIGIRKVEVCIHCVDIGSI